MTQLSQNELIAIQRYQMGEDPSYSTSIADELTAGYGELSEYGYWEYPLPCDGTGKILIHVDQQRQSSGDLL